MWVCCVLVCCLDSQAGGFIRGYQGHYGLSMGMATPTLAYDASAAYLNPGAMSMVRRRILVQFGGHYVRHTTSFLAFPPNTTVVDMDTAFTSPVYLYAFYRGRRGQEWNRWSIGLSVTSPYSLTSRWPSDWAGQFISQEFSLSSLFIQPTFGVQVTPKLGLGFGFSVGVVSLLSRRAIDKFGAGGTRSSVSFGGAGTGSGLNLGLFYQASSNLAIGLNAKTPMLIRVRDGNATFSVPSILEEQYPNQTFQTEFTLPGELQAGLSLWPQENVQVALAVKYRFWQSFDSLIFELEQAVPDLQAYPERNYRNTTSYHFGIDYTYNERLAFRGGVYYDDSPVQAEYLSPEFPDGDRIGITFGAEARISRWLTAELSYQYEYNPERTGRLASANFGGTYASANLAIGAGFKVAF